MEIPEFFKEIYIPGEIHVFKMLYNGKWVESASGKTIPIKSPVDDSIVGYVQAATADEANNFVRNADESWKAWNALTVSERAAVLHKVDDLIHEYKDILISTLIMEIGKTRPEAENEVIRTADLTHYFAEEGRRFYGEIIWGDSFPGYSKEKMCLVYKEPMGAILAIGPFNYPLNLSASKIAPALVTGNSVVFKPPQQGSISALFMSEIFRAAGTPAGVLNTITGSSSQIGDVLATNPCVAMIAFTGSTKVGQHIGLAAGMIPFLMELGGKDAAIVLEDADFDMAAKQIAKGAFSYSGQRCTAVKRILAVGNSADKLTAKMLPIVKSYKVGDPREADTFIGPVISDESADYVQSLIDDAITKGASLLCGNKRKGRYINPTVLDNVTEEMRVAWEEPFGPVLPIMRCDSIEEAVAVANKSQYGLQSCIFTQDIDKAFYAGKELEVGTVNINGADSRGPDHFPFLGVKNSGTGTQGVHYSISAMTRTKAITLNLRK